MPRPRRDIPWLEWRGGTAYVCWYDAGQKRTRRQSLGTKDSTEAQKRYAAFLVEGPECFDGNGQRAAGLTVTQAIDDYLREHVTTKVIDRTRAEVIARHLKAYFVDTLVKDVDIPASRAYAEARRTGAVGGGKRRHVREGADSTIRRELVVLGAAARHAMRWKRITAAELPSIELPVEARKEAEWLTKIEIAKAIESATGTLRDFIEIAYYTAGRRASIECLTKFQVDLKNNRINLRAPTESALQRGSRKRRPIVPIDPKLRPTVERLMSAGESDNTWLLGSNKDMYRHFAEHMAAIGLPEKSNPHILRHSRATHLLQDGVSLYDVARLLGDTVATCERVYGHHSPDYLGAAIGGRA